MDLQRSVGFAFIVLSWYPGRALASPDKIVQKDYATLPGMKVFWDGKPMNEFDLLFIDPLKMSMGAISQDGYTLLQCALGTDAAGYSPLANPGYAAATPLQRQQNANRNHRLFACIMNYILSTTPIYILLMQTFVNDGISALRMIQQFGRLPWTSIQLRKMESFWDELSLLGLKIAITSYSLFLLSHRIQTEGRRLGKTNAQMKTKFCQALPQQAAFMRSQQIANRTHIGYVIPANYPAYYPPALRGTPHPNAGECDMNALPKFLHEDWNTLIRDDVFKALRSRPNVHEVSEFEFTEEEVSLIKHDRVLEDTSCNYCGGAGHGTETELPDGTIVVCPRKSLGFPPVKKGSNKKPFVKPPSKKILEPKPTMKGRDPLNKKFRKLTKKFGPQKAKRIMQLLESQHDTDTSEDEHNDTTEETDTVSECSEDKSDGTESEIDEADLIASLTCKD
jgi:hypothetical protein